MSAVQGLPERFRSRRPSAGARLQPLLCSPVRDDADDEGPEHGEPAYDRGRRETAFDPSTEAPGLIATICRNPSSRSAARSPPRKRERERLHEELRDDAPAARAQRRADAISAWRAAVRHRQRRDHRDRGQDQNPEELHRPDDRPVLVHVEQGADVRRDDRAQGAYVAGTHARAARSRISIGFGPPWKPRERQDRHVRPRPGRGAQQLTIAGSLQQGVPNPEIPPTARMP